MQDSVRNPRWRNTFLRSTASTQSSPPQQAGAPPVRFECFATPSIRGGGRTCGATSRINRTSSGRMTQRCLPSFCSGLCPGHVTVAAARTYDGNVPIPSSVSRRLLSSGTSERLAGSLGGYDFVKVVTFISGRTLSQRAAVEALPTPSASRVGFYHQPAQPAMYAAIGPSGHRADPVEELRWPAA